MLATQRPGVDVITGLIKANVPARIGFTVASQVDSRTILDQIGAEKLLGQGDMLMVTPSMSKPKRIQGAWVTDGEVVRITDHLRMQACSTVQQRCGCSAGSAERQGRWRMDMGSRVVTICSATQRGVLVEGRKASTSYLQMRLRAGVYSRAARIMAEDGRAGDYWSS